MTLQCPDCRRDVLIVGGNPRCVKCCKIVPCTEWDEKQLRKSGMVLHRLSGKKVGKAIAEGIARMRELERTRQPRPAAASEDARLKRRDG